MNKKKRLEIFVEPLQIIREADPKLTGFTDTAVANYTLQKAAEKILKKAS